MRGLGLPRRAPNFGRDGTEARNPLQTGTHQKLLGFWRIYFKAAGANLIEMGQNVIVRRQRATNYPPNRAARRPATSPASNEPSGARTIQSCSARYFCGSYSVMPSFKTPAV